MLNLAHLQFKKFKNLQFKKFKIMYFFFFYFITVLLGIVSKNVNIQLIILKIQKMLETV